jgi:hypothetical protein
VPDAPPLVYWDGVVVHAAPEALAILEAWL